jgi:antitoxin ParD1/3/4
MSRWREYMRELIRRDQERQALRRLLLAGAASALTDAVDAGYFESLRAGVRGKRQ